MPHPRFPLKNLIFLAVDGVFRLFRRIRGVVDLGGRRRMAAAAWEEEEGRRDNVSVDATMSSRQSAMLTGEIGRLSVGDDRTGGIVQ